MLYLFLNSLMQKNKEKMKIPLQDSDLCDISISTSTGTEPTSPVNVERKKSLWGMIDARLIRKVTAEAVGTYILMFCIGGIMANLQKMGVKTGLMEYAATAGLTVIVIVFSISSISGAHVNPAVTIAFATLGPFPWSEVPFYIVAQVGGSVLATYSGRFVYGIEPNIMTTGPLQGTTSAFFVEFIATFIILFLITSLISESQSSRPRELTGFVAGVGIGLGVLITGPVSGGSMNPARSLGPALVAWEFDGLWIYILAPTMGAVAGVFIYRVLRLKGWTCDSDSAQLTLQLDHSSLY